MSAKPEICTFADGSHRPTSAYTQNLGTIQDQTTQAKTNLSHFTKTERAQTAHPFKKYYTTNKDVTTGSVNRFEGRSNYNHYYPSDSLQEQKMEKLWQEARNKQLAEKRRNEETQKMVREWSSAKSRLEVEIQRKKE